MERCTFATYCVEGKAIVVPQCDTQVTLCKHRLEQIASKIAPSIPWYATPPCADNRLAAAASSVESYQHHLVVMPTRIPSRPLLTPSSRRESPFRRHSQKVWCAATLDCPDDEHHHPGSFANGMLAVTCRADSIFLFPLRSLPLSPFLMTKNTRKNK